MFNAVGKCALFRLSGRHQRSDSLEKAEQQKGIHRSAHQERNGIA
jgi:hypothetical protein